MLQIAETYAEQNDADALRRDPLRKLVCGRLPATDPDLASQPTLSRFENRISTRDSYQLAEALGQVYLRRRERDVQPSGATPLAAARDLPGAFMNKPGSSYLAVHVDPVEMQPHARNSPQAVELCSLRLVTKLGPAKARGNQDGELIPFPR